MPAGLRDAAINESALSFHRNIQATADGTPRQYILSIIELFFLQFL